MLDVKLIGIGAVDGLSDTIFNVVDVHTGKASESFSKRPSTWLHIATSAGLGILSYMEKLPGDLDIVANVIAGRHLAEILQTWYMESKTASSQARLALRVAPPPKVKTVATRKTATPVSGGLY